MLADEVMMGKSQPRGWERAKGLGALFGPPGHVSMGEAAWLRAQDQDIRGRVAALLHVSPAGSLPPPTPPTRVSDFLWLKP